MDQLVAGGKLVALYGVEDAVGSFELQGFWWLPDHPGHRVPGVLTWDPDSGGSLKLVGTLRPIVLLDNHLPDGQVQKYRDRTHDGEKSYPVVLGQVEDTAYTVVNAFQTSRREWSLEQATETVHVNAVLDGAWFDGPELEVDRVRIRMRDLAEWVDVTGLDATYPRMNRTGEEFAVVTAVSMPDRVVPSSSPRVLFGQRLEGTSRGKTSLGIEQDWALHITQKQVAPLKTFIEVASDVQDLVSIATGRTAEFRSVVLHHPDLPELSMAGTPVGKARQDLNFHAQWSNRVDHGAGGPASDEPLSTFRMCFTLEHLTLEGLGRWLETAAKFRTELGRTMATRYGRDSYLEDRIMNVCAALESFDKHHRGVKEANYVDRIEECIKLAGQEFRDFIVEDPVAWAKRVKDLRHDLAHHRERFRLEGSVGGHLISEQLFWLFVLCMLRVAQAPDAVFESISKHQEAYSKRPG